MKNDELRSQPSLPAMTLRSQDSSAALASGGRALSVTGALAAIDVQDLARDEGGIFQEQHGVDDVF